MHHLHVLGSIAGVDCGVETQFLQNNHCFNKCPALS